MGTKIANKKGGLKAKRAVANDRLKEATKPPKPVAKQQEELSLASESDSEADEFHTASETEKSTDEEAEVGAEAEAEEEEEEEEQQLGGFSSTDESDDDNEINEDSEDEEPQPQKKTKNVETHEVKPLPKKAAAALQKAAKTKTGVIYIGRLPEGFEETELNKYFNQFGEITNVKVPRSKKSGRSKHYAFVEFQNADDAKVAQETMNNYLLLNHQLKVNLVDEEFKSSKKFKKAYFKVSKPTKDVKTLNEKANKKKEQRKKSLKSAGINF